MQAQEQWGGQRGQGRESEADSEGRTHAGLIPQPHDYNLSRNPVSGPSTRCPWVFFLIPKLDHFSSPLKTIWGFPYCTSTSTTSVTPIYYCLLRSLGCSPVLQDTQLRAVHWPSQMHFPRSFISGPPKKVFPQSDYNLSYLGRVAFSSSSTVLKLAGTTWNYGINKQRSLMEWWLTLQWK